MNFDSLSLPNPLLQAVASMDYTEMTPIQEKVIPVVLDGHDVLASSHTGSGKTAAFAVPIVAKLMESAGSIALIMAPTRELATQVMGTLRSLTTGQSKLRTALLIGGDPITKQFKDLRSKPRIVVGTPGRINDHLKRKTLNLSNTKFLVLDETDRMLDMGFGVQLEAIAEHLPETRQTLMFSATLSKQIERLAQRYLNNAVHVKIGADRAPAPNVSQENINVTEQDKHQILLTELDNRSGSILIFVKTKHGAQNLADKLVDHNHQASALHGDLSQRHRDRVMKRFRDKTYRIMVATDIAARGLDILHIEHVINYDPPQLAEDYIHRIGRTARAGRVGASLNLVSKKDSKKWSEIRKMLAGKEPIQSDLQKHKFGEGRSSDNDKFSNGKKRTQRPFRGRGSDERSHRSDKEFSIGRDKPRAQKFLDGGSVERRSFGRSGDKSQEQRFLSGESVERKSFDKRSHRDGGFGRSGDKPREQKFLNGRSVERRSFDMRSIGERGHHQGKWRSKARRKYTR